MNEKHMNVYIKMIFGNNLTSRKKKKITHSDLFG